MLALMKTAPGPGHVELRDMPEPSPCPGQVMIEVGAAGICASDLHIRDWDIQLNLRPPVIMGHEFAGSIAALGDGVDGFSVGDSVTSETAFSVCGRCIPCRMGDYNACAKKELIGFVHNGCFARYVVVPAGRVHKLPAGVDVHSAAMCEPLAVVVRGALELTDIHPGDLVVVAGPGSIGLLAVQVARAAGARVVVSGATGDQARLAMALELGAERAVNVLTEDLAAVVREMGYEDGADVYLECSGAPASVRAGLNVTRRRGQYTQIGLPSKPFELDFALIAYKELIVHGELGQKWSVWRRALRLLESGQVVTKPLISDVFPLTEWARAFERFESRQGLKVLLTPA